MKKKYLVSILTATLISSSNVYAQTQETVMNEVEAIRQELQILQRQIYREQNESYANPESISDMGVKISEIEEKLRYATGQFDEINHKLQQLDNKIDLINKDIDVRIKMIEGKPIEGMGSTNEEKAKFNAPVAIGAPKSLTGDSISKGEDLAPVNTKPISQIYEEGLEAVKINDYSLAEQRFNEILRKAPEDKLAGNAQYWLGEVFYGQQNYQKAAVAFAKVIEKYKSGPKGADSLLKLGLSMQNLKKTTEACQAFQSMNSEFPKAEAKVLERAKTEAKKLGCK